MTETKLAEFAKGDQVTGPKGIKLVVINQGSPGGAVLCETPPDKKPYDSTFYAADSLKKVAAKKAPAKNDKKGADKTPPADETYIVSFTDADGGDQTIDVTASSADDAAAKFADLANEGETFVDVAKAGE